MRGASALMIDLSTTCRPEQRQLYSLNFPPPGRLTGDPGDQLERAEYSDGSQCPQVHLALVRSDQGDQPGTEEDVVRLQCTVLAYPVTTTTKSMMFQTFLR